MRSCETKGQKRAWKFVYVHKYLYLRELTIKLPNEYSNFIHHLDVQTLSSGHPRRNKQEFQSIIKTETKAENQIANAIIEESASKDDSEDNPNANNIASEAKNELDTEHDKIKTKIDSNKDEANEIEDIYSHLKLMQQLESGGNRDIETPEEKKVGKKMDFSV